MTVRDLVIENRSVRAFDEGVRIPGIVLREYVDVVRLTASARNAQPLKYRLVYKPEEAEAFFALTRWAGYITDMKLPPDGQHPVAFIVICHDTEVDPHPENFQVDVGIAAQTITLAAVEDGYNACMIGSFSKDKASELLGLSENLKPQLVIAIGKGAESPILCDVKDGDTKYFRDKAGVHFVPKRRLEDIVID